MLPIDTAELSFRLGNFLPEKVEGFVLHPLQEMNTHVIMNTSRRDPIKISRIRSQRGCEKFLGLYPSGFLLLRASFECLLFLKTPSMETTIYHPRSIFVTVEPSTDYDYKLTKHSKKVRVLTIYHARNLKPFVSFIPVLIHQPSFSSLNNAKLTHTNGEIARRWRHYDLSHPIPTCAKDRITELSG